MNNIPDKIYIPRTNMEVENNMEEFWLDHKTFDSDVEYIRKDAFIEKAKEFLWEYIDGTDYHVNYILKEFEKYMKD